ncbi:ribonuclease P protein component [Flavobacterium agricola]|uniref:Ribonuclease P protein component n=1 Tax=Flavobacterium agricola TaxID=2870839 RepID=A0ABY6M1D1_9FLAO|nr:ribonuclease P protein component [Flavobacterium agricola]UYW01033.1 ribonuclease P protein component [Flavobacterium agricola]
MKQNYPKAEKLKTQKHIDLLFTKGKSVSKYPLRLVYVALEEGTDAGLQMGVSVSKKYFKRANKRNYFKRVLRETYRKNKSIIYDAIGEKPYAMMFFYQAKDKLSYQEIEQKTIDLFTKFKDAIQ